MAKPPRAPFWSGRKALLLFGVTLFIACLSYLGTDFTHHSPGSQPLKTAGDFFSAALHPTLTDQNPSLPDGATPFSSRLLSNLLNTLRYAFIAMSMAIPLGLLLGLVSSRTWWRQQQCIPFCGRFCCGGIFILIRLFTTFIRSIHKLIWVLLFFSMLGDNPLSACFAIALPFAGTLAKVFSEIIDEQDATTSTHIQSSGGSNLQSFITARFRQALPDILTYSFYRLECAIRASAVLGFVGLETLGLSIQQSFENTYYEEVWSALYLLIATIILFDLIGSLIRKRLNNAPVSHKKSGKSHSLSSLKKSRPRWILLRLIPITLGICTIAAWFTGPPLNAYHSATSRWERTEKFFHQLTPEPLRNSGDSADSIQWAKQLWNERGAEALLETLVMATMAILLSAFACYLIVPWASRAIANKSPFGVRTPKLKLIRGLFWWLLGLLTRFIFILTRAIPEYILAYILLSLLGLGIWPLVLALALHNFGILGRLWSEIIDNNRTPAAKHIYLKGGSRLQAYTFGIVPANTNRQLLYIFYRWETCVRESTVLGMLGVASLGYHISIESAHLRYDSMLYFILLGTLAIFAADLLSIYLRSRLKGA